MRTTKIVMIGAGSICFGLSMFKDLFTCGELRGSTLSLVDIDRDSLARMYELAVKMNELSAAGLRIERTTERKDVLPVRSSSSTASPSSATGCGRRISRSPGNTGSGIPWGRTEVQADYSSPCARSR